MYMNSGCQNCHPYGGGGGNPIKHQMRQQTASILQQNGVNPGIMREVGQQMRQLKASGQYRPGMRQQLMTQALQRNGANPQQINNILSQSQSARQQIKSQYGGGGQQQNICGNNGTYCFAGAQPFAGAQAFAGNGFAGAQAFAGFSPQPAFTSGFGGGQFPFA